MADNSTTPQAIPSTEKHNSTFIYDDNLGASATKLFGSFVGIAAFILISMALSFISQDSPFPVIHEITEAIKETMPQSVRSINVIFAIIILVHHSRVFAGFTFAEDDKNFGDVLKRINNKTKIRTFRSLKFFFLITYPLFVLCSRLENGCWFKIIWCSQVTGAIVFDIVFWKEIFQYDIDRRQNFLVLAADFVFLCIAFYIAFPFCITDPANIMLIAGIALGVCVLASLSELFFVYRTSLKRMFFLMRKYLCADGAGELKTTA